ncbi:MAG: ABC transporter permease subunit [Anaerolineae bacterium]
MATKTDKDATGPSSKAALRRLLIVLAIAAGVVIYAYGWQVTDINLESAKAETRQESVTRALRELLSPNIFTQDTETDTFEAGFIYDCTTGEGQPVETEGASIRLTPACGTGRDTILVEGSGFAPATDVELHWNPPEGQPRPLGSALTDNLGSFQTEITIPNIRGVQQGAQAAVAATAILPVGSPRLSSTTHLVIEKMIETIFLALIATTLAVPVSVVISFMAAHNLMQSIRMPIGKALIGIALVPLGWALGQAVLGPLTASAIAAGQGQFNTVAGPAILFIVSIGAVQVGRKAPRTVERSKLVSRIITLAATCIGLILLGFLAGLAITSGDALMRANIPLVQYLGNFLRTMGQIVELLLPPLCGLAIGVYLAGIGMGLYTAHVRKLSPTASHIGGAILGAIAGGLILAAVAAVASQAALMTLLLPLLAGLLGAQIPLKIFERTLGHANPLDRSPGESALRPIIWVVGFLVGFTLTFALFDVSRSIVQGRLPVFEIMLPRAALVGGLLGGITAGLTGITGNMPVGPIVYNITRTTLNALRSIEPLILGIVFVIWVGIGPFAGVLALTLNSIASLGKLFSEQIESIDEGPIEALHATGANHVQTIIYAVVPQIVPSYIAFTLYRWDINVRMSTIIGFVGGGGIGFLLQQQINLLRYREAGVAVLAIALVVSILDYASASIRQRVT